MKLTGRIPVEPLDDERLVNIERRLVVGVSELARPPMRAPRRGLALAATALAIAVAGVAGWKLHAPASHGAAPAPQVVAVATETDRSTLELAGAQLASTPGTRIAVTHTAARVIVTMQRGTIDLAVDHRPDRILVVRAGDTEIEDIGTKFSVTYDGASSVDVRVTEGEVAVTRQQHTDRVAAGSEWNSGTVVALAATPAADAGPGATIGASTHDGAGSGAVQVAVAPPPEILHDRHAAVPPPPDHPHRRPHRVHTAAPAVPSRAHPRPARPVDPYVDLKRAIKQQKIAFDPGIDGKGDAATEIARLKKVAYSPTTMGADASAALYRIAVLLYRPLGQNAEALRTLDMYRRRFAAGREYAAAAWLRLRIECTHAIDDRCRQAAYSYQHVVTTGDAANVAIRITNAQ